MFGAPSICANSEVPRYLRRLPPKKRKGERLFEPYPYCRSAFIGTVTATSFIAFERVIPAFSNGPIQSTTTAYRNVNATSRSASKASNNANK